MKNWKQFFLPIAILQLFLIAAGSSSFASTPGLIATDLQNGKQYKTTDHQKIYFFEENENFSGSQNLLDQENNSVGQAYISGIDLPNFQISEADNLDSGYLTDKRSNLSKTIFPFHFFW